MEKNNKIIHYIWFGGNPISELTKKCIATWKKYLPDFEIKEWNENNFDVTQCPFVKEAFEQKKWAFVADYTRFKVLEEYGGIYLDTDMEITADISKFLEDDLFLGVEDSKQINAAVVWVKEAHNPYIKDIVDIYESKKKFNETGDLYDESVPKVLTKYFSKFGFDGEKDEIQIFEDNKIHIYPMEYFYPLSYDYQNNKFTDNSVMIHHFDATWIKPMEKFKTKMKRKNMVWVVYIIDFFISIKNKIKFFSNNRDLTIFFTMFLTMFLAMLTLKPINDVGIFSNISVGGKSLLQIVGFSFIWTFVTAKIRNIDLNSYVDRITNFNPDNENYKAPLLNLEQTLKLQKRERIIYLFQFITTLFVAFLPILELVNILPNNTTIFGLLLILNMYYIYLGIKKKYKYRILELVPYAIILSLMIVLNPAIGILISIVTFGFILYKLINLKIKPKRLKSFVITYIACTCLFIILSVAIPNFDKFDSLNFGSNLIENNELNEIDTVELESEVVTQFNAAKPVFYDNIKDTIISNVSLYPNLYVIISITLIIIIYIVSKKLDYIFLIVQVLLSSIYIMSISIGSLLYISCVCFAFILLFAVEIIVDKILTKMWEE